MKIAVIGSRNLKIEDISKFIPQNADEIVSGGAKGIDTVAKNFAISRGLKYTEFKPEYNKYGRAAPLKRNLKIIDYADFVVAIWDGKSAGTMFVIKNCARSKIAVYII